MFMPSSGVELAAALLLGVSVLAIYLDVVTPLNVGADAHWYHLPMAEHYAAAGAIRPSPEGWYFFAFPHLATILYTWAHLAPGKLHDKIALCSHLEFTLLLVTLGGISVLTRRLVGGRRHPFAAAAFFLFPGIFVYDSSLITQADHILAFWGCLLGVVLVRLGRDYVWNEAVLVGMMLAGALLTRYQSIYFLIPTGLFVGLLAVYWRRWVPGATWLLVSLAGSSAHWLKNWISHGDPLYPVLHRYLPSHPLYPGAEQLIQVGKGSQFVLTGTASEKFYATLEALVNFSFVPHDWDFHGKVPLFGSLFTLLLPMLIFCRPRRRLWLLVVAVHIGVATWFVIFHQDRYLRALVPWMAACTAATLILVWRSGYLARAGAAALVALQVVWTADTPFYRVHNMIGDAPLKAAVDFVYAGRKGNFKNRFRHGFSMEDLNAKLPKDTKVLVHCVGEKLGLQRQFVSDLTGWQGLIDYLALDSPETTWKLWKELGIGHAVWWNNRPDRGVADWARDAVFMRTVATYGGRTQSAGPWRFSEIGDKPRGDAEGGTWIAWLGCNDRAPDGLYSPRGLSERSSQQRFDAPALRDLPSQTNVILHRHACRLQPSLWRGINARFRKVDEAAGTTLYVRRRAHR